MIAEAFRLLHEEVGMIPLHQQALAWGVAKGVSAWCSGPTVTSASNGCRKH